MKHPTHEQGFTLMELMVTVIIIGIIAAMAAPSFQRQIAAKKIESSLNQLQNCIKNTQADVFITRKDLSIKINNSTLECGDTPAMSIESGVNITIPSGKGDIVLRTNRLIYPSNNLTTPIGDTNYVFCHKDFSEINGKLTVNSRGNVTVSKGGESCS